MILIWESSTGADDILHRDRELQTFFFYTHTLVHMMLRTNTSHAYKYIRALYGHMVVHAYKLHTYVHSERLMVREHNNNTNFYRRH